MEEAEWFMTGFMAGLGFGLGIVNQRVRDTLGSLKLSRKKKAKDGEN
jgi:C4-dicarboxylate-specific signal transduction histidine kinase